MFSCKQVPAFVLAFLVALLCGGTGVAWGAAPTIKGISPNNGSVTGSTQVTISGEGFIAGSTVKFGGSAGTGVTIASSTQIKVTSPVGTGLAGISVTNTNGTSAATPYDQFGYDAAPTAQWLGLDGNSSTYLGPVGYFAEREIVYDRSGPIEFTAGGLPDGAIETDLENGMIPVVAIEYSGYNGTFKSDPEFPQKRSAKEEAEGKGTIKTYVHGFIKTAVAVLDEEANKSPETPLMLEPMNEPWGYTTPQFNGAEYAEVIAELLPEAQRAGIPLADIYVAAIGKKWVPKMYEAQAKLKTEIQGWYLHPYGPPSGTHEENSEGIQSVPYVQAEMTSGQNNVIVSEVGYCAKDINEGKGCDGTEESADAATHLTEMLDNAQPYHEAGWLKALLVYSRNDGGWAMQIEPGVGMLTRQGKALDAFAEGDVGWSILSPTNQGSTKENHLGGVSCTSSSFCVAVGHYQASGFHGLALGEFLKSAQWKIDNTIAPSESPYSELNGVSCVTTTSCIAVGEYSQVKVFAEGWDGAKWQAQLVPPPSGGALLIRLKSISCSSTTVCTAVGSYFPKDPFHSIPLAERWNGTVWQVQTTVNPETLANRFRGVACPSSAFCMAVGAAEGKPLAESWSGKEWQSLTTPSASGELIGVSCPSTSICLAVGRNTSAGRERPLAERWDGSEWHIESAPNPLGAKEGRLTSVSCTSITACTAVGYYTGRSGAVVTLAEIWNGVEWSIQSTSPPAEAKASRLEGVSCTGSLACVAVGESENSSSEWLTVAEINF